MTNADEITPAGLVDLARAIDQATAVQSGALSHAMADAGRAVAAMRRLLGQQCTFVRGQRHWAVSEQDTVAAVKARLESGEPFGADRLRTALGQLANAQRAADAAGKALADLDAIFTEYRWSRFFSVPNGHVHANISSGECSRTPSTVHGWHPELSGLTEADAVAQLGPLLCSRCFPSAPVEWTVGRPKSDRCQGSGRYASS